MNYYHVKEKTRAKHTSPLLRVKNPRAVLFICLSKECFGIFCWITGYCCSYNLKKYKFTKRLGGKMQVQELCHQISVYFG